MKHCIRLLSAFVFVAVVVYGGLYLVRNLKYERRVPFKHVAQLTAYNEMMQYDAWFPINDLMSFDLKKEDLEDFCDIQSVNMNFEEYTYIVTCGYTLEELTYNYWDRWGKLSLSAGTFHGRTVLRRDCPSNTFNVYQIPKMRISNDIHARWISERIVYDI